MCRIAGLVDPGRSGAERQQLVSAMLSRMAAGGPDGEGQFSDDPSGVSLGHRRLAIVDLTDAGRQPMIGQQGELVISYNGEIYNFKGLRDELHALGFHCVSRTDTEVILQAYACWGVQAFSKLEGMFAFALWDVVRQQVWLVRDEAGIKPLYYLSGPKRMAFASSVKALRILPEAQDNQPIWPVLFLAYGHLPGPITTQLQVKPVPPGRALCYDLKHSSITEHPLTSPFRNQQLFTNRVEAREAMQSTMRMVLERQFFSDAPIGLFLSGGIDSSILALVGSQIRPDLHTSAVHFSESAFSELGYQELIRAQIPHGNHASHVVDASLFFDALPRILLDGDLPSCDGINTWFIAQFAHEEGLKAVLSGLGADEYWGGYPSFTRIAWVQRLSQLPASVWKSARYTQHKALRRLVFLRLGGRNGAYLFLRGLFVPQEIAQILDVDEQEVWTILEEFPRNEPLVDGHRFDQASSLEINSYMRDQLLRDSDTMGMAHGLEIRVPYLDPALVALAQQIPAAWKQPTQQVKPMLVDAFRDILPEKVWNRPKMGFTFPFADWFKNDAKAGPFFASLPPVYYEQFLRGQLHWSKLYTLKLIDSHVHG